MINNIKSHCYRYCRLRAVPPFPGFRYTYSRYCRDGVKSHRSKGDRLCFHDCFTCKLRLNQRRNAVNITTHFIAMCTPYLFNGVPDARPVRSTFDAGLVTQFDPFQYNIYSLWNSLIIHEENTKEIISVKASVYAIHILVDLHKL